MHKLITATTYDLAGNAHYTRASEVTSDTHTKHQNIGKATYIIVQLYKHNPGAFRPRTSLLLWHPDSGTPSAAF